MNAGRAPKPRGRRSVIEPLLYALFAGGLTLLVACRFYASVRLQTAYTANPPITQPGEWSAPLDDVFIHFDFARAAARGHFFEWSEGNGYSSGGTSLLYPFVLAPGWWLGFRGPLLVLWAAIVGSVSTFALLLAARRMFVGMPRWTSYLAPISILGIGVLSWSLFSGMEVAFFLGIWAGALIAWDDLWRAPKRLMLQALWLGLWNALLVATRPEAVITVAVLASAAAFSIWRPPPGTSQRRLRDARRALSVLLAASLPAVAVLVAHAIANRALTGEMTAAGALAKLELHHPHLSRQQVWDAWKFHVEYQILRVTHYHLTDTAVFGWIPWILSALSLGFRATRRYAIVLWLSAIGWVLLVALNGQVRWQNERYTMPAVAWLLLGSALGTGALISSVRGVGGRGAFSRALAWCGTALAIGVFADHHVPRYRDQIWFFGRASRNIRDQHVMTGRLIRHGLEPRPRRVLVGDAGAIPYAADLPALDIIGLGGYHGLPFARATRLGVGAAIELIERMPARERPDLLAIYPSWWGLFPVWFGEKIAEVPVRGNVICGGHSKVLYRPKWEALAQSGLPISLAAGERVVDELDVADLISEKQHTYTVSGGMTFVDMKLLPHPKHASVDLWDAGRVVGGGVSESFQLSGLDPQRPLSLVLRLAPARAGTIEVHVGEAHVGSISFEASDGWIEPTLRVPQEQVKPFVRVRLSSAGERVIHHVWAVESK